MARKKAKKKEPDAGYSSESNLVCVIRVRGPCNNRCSFCSPAESEPVSTEEVYQRVSSPTHRSVIIDGPGEPLMHNEIVRLVNTAKRAGAARLAIFTNGRMLSCPPVASLIARQKPDAVILPLLHTNREIHDGITRAENSFTQTLHGLKNLLKYCKRNVTKIYLRFIPLKENQDQLTDLCRIVKSENLTGIIVDPLEDRAHITDRLIKDIDALKARGEPIMTRKEFEKELSSNVKPIYSSEGTAPARFHENEMALSLVVRTGCRNACNFCTTRIIQEENSAPWPLDDPETFFDDIRNAYGQGARKLRMVAIEPLEHPEITKLIQFAKETGFEKIEAWTSGRALSEPALAERLQKAGLTNVDIPIMGSSGSIHDSITSSRGSFEETMAGISNAGRFNIGCTFHLIITKQNLQDMERMAELGERLKLGRPASILIPSPSSYNLDHYRSFMPSYSDVMNAILGLPEAAATTLLSRGLLNNIPPCVILAASEEFSSLIRRYKPARQDWIRDGNLSEPGAKLKLRKKCGKSRKCSLAGICVGYHSLYENLFGTSEFQPVKRKQES